MDAYYDWIKDNREKHLANPASLEWPANMLAWSEFTEGFHEEVIEVADVEAVRRFRQVLADHGAVLASAREKLREFIKDKFNVDEVLYVSKGIPRTED
jgi:hypothetical protein